MIGLGDEMKQTWSLDKVANELWGRETKDLPMTEVAV